METQAKAKAKAKASVLPTASSHVHAERQSKSALVLLWLERGADGVCRGEFRNTVGHMRFDFSTECLSCESHHWGLSPWVLRAHVIES